MNAWLTFPNDKEATIGRLYCLTVKNKFCLTALRWSSFLQKRDDVKMANLLSHFLLWGQDIENAKNRLWKFPLAHFNMPYCFKGFLRVYCLQRRSWPEALPNAYWLMKLDGQLCNVRVGDWLFTNQLNQGENSLSFWVAPYGPIMVANGIRMLLAWTTHLAETVPNAMRSYEFGYWSKLENYVALNY